MQKRQTPEKGFALFKNDITDFLPAPELKIHSRSQRFDNKKDRAITDPAFYNKRLKNLR